jgi:hypothetical protein
MSEGFFQLLSSFHRGLIIDPNDWWIMVVQQVTRYISENGESLRDVFVNFEGKKELVALGASDSIESWEKFMSDMASDISKNIKIKLNDYLKPDFSTSTHTQQACIDALTMKGMDKFFGYKFMTMCGLRYIEMRGVEDDYVRLISKTRDLMNLPGGIGDNLTPYLQNVTDIFEKFLETFRGNVDKNFWDTNHSYKNRGSGSTIITGWVRNMVCYSEEGEFLGNKKIDECSNLPCSYSTVEFKWSENGFEREHMRLMTGLISVEVVDGGEAYKPVSGWIVYDDSKDCNIRKETEEFNKRAIKLARSKLLIPIDRTYGILENNEPEPQEKDPVVADDIDYLMEKYNWSYEKSLDTLLEQMFYNPPVSRLHLDEIACRVMYNQHVIHFIINTGFWPYQKAVEIHKELENVMFQTKIDEILNRNKEFRNEILLNRLHEKGGYMRAHNELMKILLNDEEI